MMTRMINLLLELGEDVLRTGAQTCERLVEVRLASGRVDLEHSGSVALTRALGLVRNKVAPRVEEPRGTPLLATNGGVAVDNDSKGDLGPWAWSSSLRQLDPVTWLATHRP
jgi:hypothetical protein